MYVSYALGAQIANLSHAFYIRFAYVYYCLFMFTYVLHARPLKMRTRTPHQVPIDGSPEAFCDSAKTWHHIALHHVFSPWHDSTLPFLPYITYTQCTVQLQVLQPSHMYTCALLGWTAHVALCKPSSKPLALINWRNQQRLAPDLLSKGCIRAASHRYAHARVQTWEKEVREGMEFIGSRWNIP